MIGSVALSQQMKITAPNGTVVWTGAAILGVTYYAETDGTSISPGEACGLDSADSIIPRFDHAASDEPPKVKLMLTRVSVGTTQFLGVAIENILQLASAALGDNASNANVAGVGSILGIKSLTAASLSSNTIGACITRSTSAGSVDSGIAGAAAAFLDNKPLLGYVLQIAGTGAGESGSLTVLSGLIAPRGIFDL